MTKVAVVTDSNAGIEPTIAKEMGIHVIPMPFSINGETYFEDVNLSQEDFYKFLEQDADVVTSQPFPGDTTKMYEELLKEYDEIIHIPMSSGLSGTYQTAHMLAQDYNGKVHVADTLHVSITLRNDIYDAIQFAKEGKTATEIKTLLEDNRANASIYLTVTTLENLKKGGRITPAVALLGGMLKIKPILQIQGEKLDTFNKTRTLSKAHKIMLEAIQQSSTERFNTPIEDQSVAIAIAYTKDIDQANEFKALLQEALPNKTIDIVPLSLSVACHTGPGALGVGVYKKITKQ